MRSEAEILADFTHDAWKAQDEEALRQVGEDWAGIIRRCLHPEAFREVYRGRLDALRAPEKQEEQDA
ncbi:MAG: hypothetical protein ACK4HD_07360 [Pannonibacter phragmitetus]